MRHHTESDSNKMSTVDYRVVDTIDDVNRNQWNNVVSQSETGTIFHRTPWLHAIEEGLGYNAKHVIVEKNGNPQAVFPNFISAVENPFDLPVNLDTTGLAQLSSVSPGFGGPVVVGSKESTLEALFEAVDSIQEWNIIAHRMRLLDAAHVQYAQMFRTHGYTPSLLYCRLWLRLDEYDRIREEMDSGRRKELRNAEEHDPEVRVESFSEETVDDFYTEYKKTIERVDGTLYPRSFFETLARTFEDRIRIFNAYVDGQPIGKHLCLCDTDQESLHYFFAGVDAEYFKYSGPAVLHDFAIKWALEHGYDVYDFGATSSNYQDGTFRYKQKFGANIEPVYEWEASRARLRWAAYKWARNAYVRNNA